MTRRKTALFSLYDSSGAVSYARNLVRLGWRIVATKETVKLLAESGIKATDVSRFLGAEDRYPFPPTLHPEMELALTTGNGKTIDLVYDTTYPLSKGIDVGGHTLLALASKGRRIVVNNKKDMIKVIEALRKNNNRIDPSLRQRLIDKAYVELARYYSSLTRNFSVEPLGMNTLLNGENPYQIPADIFFTDDKDPLAMGNFEQLGGERPCYTNMADFDSILKVLTSVSSAFRRQYGETPYVTVAAKHGNPCGLAADWKSKELSIEGALFGNPRAIWGGEIITNFPISKGLGRRLSSSEKRERVLGDAAWMLDIVVAPDFSEEAVRILGKNKRRKIFKNRALSEPRESGESWAYRMVRGGFLRQKPNDYILDLASARAGFSFPEKSVVDSLIIAWGAAWFSNQGGNEIAIAKERRLLTVAGGPSTVDATVTAIARARQRGRGLEGSVFAADAFFPFTDAPQELVKAGCVYGVVPGGGKKEGLVKDYFRKHKVSVFYLPEEFRGFCRH